jgi:hypothetical protein
MCIELVGGGFALRQSLATLPFALRQSLATLPFALRQSLATLLLAPRPMWRGQPYMYPVMRSSTASCRRRSSGAD